MLHHNSKQSYCEAAPQLFFMQQSLIAVYNKPIYAIDEETVKRYPVGTITESGNGS